jgi:hypothetical protein
LDPCTVETGLLRKKPCGHASVARCANCEQAICAQHAVPQLTAEKKKSGTFLCPECTAAAKEHDKSVAAAAKHDEEKKKAEIARAAVAAAAAGPKITPRKPGEPPKPPAPAAAGAPAKAAPAAPPAAKPAPKPEDDSGTIEFTPTKKP